MTIVPMSRPRARFGLLLALVSSLLLAFAMSAASPALAHDTLVSSDPADGAELDSAPQTITLTYSANILAVSPVVRLVADGGDPVDLTPTVEGPNVTADVPADLPAGKHTVQWRVVSSDGHPIEGSFTFATATGAEKPAPSDGGAATAPSDGGAASSPAAPATTEPSAAPAKDSGSGMPWLLGGIGLLVVLAIVGGIILSRRRPS